MILFNFTLIETITPANKINYIFFIECDKVLVSNI